MIKKYLLYLSLFGSLHAANYSFVDTSVNYLDWSSSTEASLNALNNEVILWRYNCFKL